MGDRKNQDLLQRLIEFDLKVLYPWKADAAQKKLSKKFYLLYLSHLSVALVVLTYTFLERNDLTFPVIIENVSIALATLRSGAYTFLVMQLYDEYKTLLTRMFDDRSLLPSDQNERRFTEALCQREYEILLVLHCIFMATGSFLVHVTAYFFPNKYHLTLNCYIFFLQPDEFSFAWEINCALIVIWIFFIGVFSMGYFHIPIMMMNHSCWLLDLAFMTAEQMNTDLKLDDDISDQERVDKTNDHLKQFAERCGKVVEWQNKVQGLLRWNFNLEFQAQTFILCLSIFVLSSDFFASYIVQNVLWFCLIQLFIYCYMGTRVTNRFEQLSFEISKNWYLMPPKQRKVVQMILHWTQNMDGFTGAFKDVSLETFQAILEGSYSFYTFLKSTSG